MMTGSIEPIKGQPQRRREHDEVIAINFGHNKSQTVRQRPEGALYAALCAVLHPLRRALRVADANQISPCSQRERATMPVPVCFIRAGCLSARATSGVV